VHRSRTHDGSSESVLTPSDDAHTTTSHVEMTG
jgi:hypothetical protein